MLDYNQLAAEYSRHRRVHPVVLQQLLEQGAVTTASHVLEVGCGTGNYISAIQAATGCHCCGIDPSMEMLSRAEAKGLPIGLLVGRAEALPYEDEAFDLIFSVDVIHHVQDRPAYLAEAFRVLKPGGQICTVTDSEWVIRHRKPLTEYWPETVAAELRRYPAMTDLKQFMAAAGFTGITEAQVEFPWELTDIRPYKEKAFSSLHLISDAAFRQGLDRLEADLARGPVPCVSYYTMLWGNR